MQKDVVKNMEDASTGLLMSIFKSEKPIDSQLPIVFKSGYKLEEFNTKCHCCSANLKGNQFKGSIFKVAKNSRFECWSVDRIDNNQADETNVEKIMIDAVGFCPQCSVYTPCQVHVEDKGLSQDEAEARERMLNEKRKDKKNKSFLGLSIQRMDSVKSQRNRAVKTDKKIHDAALGNLGVDTGRKVETTKLSKIGKEGVNDLLVEPTAPNNIKKTDFLKQSGTVKKSLIENRIDKILSKEDSDVGKNDNVTDINAIARHNLQQATNAKSKAVDAYQVGAMLTQAVIASPIVPSKSALRKEDVEVKEIEKAAPKLAFLKRGNIQTAQEVPSIPSIASQKLHSVMDSSVMDENVQSSISLTRKSHEQKTAQPSLVEELDNNSPTPREGASMLLRGNRKTGEQSVEQIEPSFDGAMNVEQDEPSLYRERRDSRGIKGSSTSAAAKIEPRKTYVQSSGSLGEKVGQVILGFFGLFSNGYKKVQSIQESRKNNILKGHAYKADKAQGRESARSRLESLKVNHEFERNISPNVKTKVKKHNHDSFR